MDDVANNSHASRNIQHQPCNNTQSQLSQHHTPTHPPWPFVIHQIPPTMFTLAKTELTTGNTHASHTTQTAVIAAHVPALQVHSGSRQQNSTTPSQPANPQDKSRSNADSRGALLSRGSETNAVAQYDVCYAADASRGEKHTEFSGCAEAHTLKVLRQTATCASSH